MNICDVHLRTKHMYEWHFPLFNDNSLPQAPSKDHSWLNIPASQPVSLVALLVNSVQLVASCIAGDIIWF